MSKDKKTALIIGAAGFVGTYLAGHLHALQWSVCGTKMKHEALAIPFAQIYDLDILDKAQILALLETVQPAVIYHLAAQSSVAFSWKNPTLTVEVNVNGTLNLLDAVRESGQSPRILLIGSGEEYGPVRPEEIPVKETTMPRPGNLYAVTKNTQNQIGRLYARAYGMDIVSTRSFNHIGPKQSPTFVVADFCKQVAEIEAGKKPPVLYVGNLSAERDFTDVRDVVRAYALLATHGVSGETYNVGQGKALSIEALLAAILALSTCKISVETDPAKLRPVDVPIIEADISKLHAATGWMPQISLADTLLCTLRDWRSSI